MKLDNDPADQPTPPPSNCPLQPPGSVLILGTDWAGLETALYSRFLGYDVSVWGRREADDPPLGPTFMDDWWASHWLGERSIDEALTSPTPMLPTRCLTSLAIEALIAQNGGGPIQWPATMSQWIDGTLNDLIHTDLLVGRVHPHRQIKTIVPVECRDEDDEPLPPDFEVHYTDGGTTQTSRTFEAIIDVSTPPAAQLNSLRDMDYCFKVDAKPDDQDAEGMMRSVGQQITRIFAGLADRQELDLYRPRRG